MILAQANEGEGVTRRIQNARLEPDVELLTGRKKKEEVVFLFSVS